MPTELQSEADIKLLVDSFYAKVTADAMLGPIFNDIAKVDWEHHLPTMYSFWSSLLLGSKSYRGQPFPKHLVLPGLTQTHFHRWIELFTQTVDELFTGKVAEEAKMRAQVIAAIFQSKLGLTSPIGIPDSK